MHHHGKVLPSNLGSEAVKESKNYKPIAEVQLKKVTKLCANSMSKVSRGRCLMCRIQYFIYS